MKWGYCGMATAHSHPVLVRTGIDLPLEAGARAFEAIVARLKAEGKNPGEWVTFCVHPLKQDDSLYGGRCRLRHSHGWYWMGPDTAPLIYPQSSAA